MFGVAVCRAVAGQATRFTGAALVGVVYVIGRALVKSAG